MQSWPKKLVLAATAAAALALCGCNEVVLANPLPHIVDDRIVGKWATPNGRLSDVITKGEGDAYIMRSADEIAKNKPGTVFYLARAGSLLFAEMKVACDEFSFATPLPSEAPKGCWEPVRISLTAQSLDVDMFDSEKMMRKSLASDLGPVNFVIGVSISGHGATRSIWSDVLIKGTSDHIAEFLGSYGTGAVYTERTESDELHKM